MASWAGEPQLLVCHHSLTCNTAAPTSHLLEAFMEDQDLTSTQQVLLKDVSSGNSHLVNSQTNQDHRFWVAELIRRPWVIGQMKVVLEATTPVTTIILATASRRSLVSSNQVPRDQGITMARVAQKKMMTMMQLYLQVVTLTLLPPYQLPPENHPK